MAKLTRVTQKIFGSAAGTNQIAEFGSLAAGSPVFTTSPSTIQSLSNYLTGWFGAVIGGNSPAIEDLNALHFLDSYQLAYLFQAGIPEYDAATVYYTNSLVQSGGVIYQSLTDTNTGNTPTSGSPWTSQYIAQANLPTYNYTLSSTLNLSLGAGSSGTLGSVTLVTVGSRPVEISLQPDGTTSSSAIELFYSGSAVGTMTFTILRNGSQIFQTGYGGPGTAGTYALPPSALKMLDTTASAGSHVYSVNVSMSGIAGSIINAKLLVQQV